MSKSYYNTINEPDIVLKKSKEKAKKQKDQIFAIYRHTLRPMTPAEIWQNYGYKDKNVPLHLLEGQLPILKRKVLLERRIYRNQVYMAN